MTEDEPRREACGLRYSAILAVTGYAVLCLAASLPAGAAQATVSGTVKNAAGEAVAHAYVEAIPVIARSRGTVGDVLNPWAAADEHGVFKLHLTAGRYRIRAKDEVDGYPDPSFGLNLDPKAHFPQVRVGESKIEGVEVVLGAQGGIISGELKDAGDAKPIADAKIHIQDASHPDAYVEIFSDRQGKFQCAVPGKPLLISATAPGYNVVNFENGAAITLSPGQHREFQIRMRHK